MASTTSSQQQNAFSGIEPPNKRRKIEESSRVFDVFINHRGPDVKLTLATQLYNSLDALGIKAFLDSEEKERGVSFISTIETAIRSASVHIAIFSKGYAESDWCLRELVLMLQSNARIIPVFYQVQPWELRHIENGVYAAAFRKYEEKGRYLDKIKEWKEALQQVSYNAGDIFENPDSSECKNIVSAVEKEVKRTKKLHVAKYPVGLHMLVKDFERRCLNELVQDFESQCGMKKAAKDRANVVGIFGMGGVGKTTLSLELFNQKRLKYTSASFLYDVREAYSRGNMPLLQSQLLKDIFCEGNHSFASDKEGMSYLTDRLEKSSSASFLIVVDDIDDVEQLHALIPMDILNKSDNNLVIVTTRNVGALVNAGIDIAYHLKGLDRDYGRELFCWHAFGKPLPNSRYENLVQDFVDLCGGLPLSIIVLGRHLFGRDQLYWQAELEKVKEILPGEIKRRLKISIDTLDNVEKQIFMDIACFFIGKSITKVMNMWKGSGWRVRHALKTLKEKCLVEEVEERYLNRLEYKWEPSVHGTALRMHDHLRDLGREMADELSHPPCVWRPQVLKSLESKGFRNILAQTKGRCFHTFFDKSMSCNIAYFLGEPEDSSDSSLLWLQLEYLNNCPLDLNSDINSSICSWIPLQNLQCLRISNGCFRKLWQTDVQAPSHLKELQIRDTFLEEFPDSLRKLNSMEKLVLDAKDIQTDNWSLLESIGMNFRSLKMMGSALAGDLAYNDTAEVITFKSLVIYDFRVLWEGAVVLNNERWSRTVMNDVENLEINNYGPATKILLNGNCCQRLQSLKICEMKNLIEVDLARIKTLSCLEITDCENFKRLSATPDLCKLVELKITECLELEELRLAHLSCLEKISIKNCNHLKSVSGAGDVTKLTRLIIGQCPALEELPSLARLSCLEDIVISSCEKLQNLTLPTTLIKLDVQSCRDLQRVAGAGDVTKLTRLIIGQCPALEELPSLARLSCLEDIVISSCEKLQNLTLPTTLIKLDVQSCRDLQRGAGAGDVTKLTRLIIGQCPALEELPSLARLSCLEDIVISSCEKLQNLTLPTTLIKLDVQSCRDLQKVAGAGDVTKLTRLNIGQCPALEELPSLARVSCLEDIVIDSCEKLRNITLPTTLSKLDVQSCRDLQRVAGAGDVTKLTWLIIRQCPALEELPSLARVGCLKDIVIDSCEKLQNITLPTTLSKLDVQSCRDLQRVAGAGDVTKLTWLIIRQCPALEELPSLARVGCLKDIVIDSCEKLQNITLPTTLSKLDVQSCRDLQRVAGAGDVTKLTWLIIRQCPALEELPSLARVGCLKDIVIDSCEKLQNITLPTTLIYLDVQSCRDLQRVAGAGDVTKLIIKQCPALEELLSLTRMSCLEVIEIDSCDKLQSITLPTTPIKLDVRSCRDLHRIAVVGDATKLTRLSIGQCPALEELLSLTRMSCLEVIEIDSCDKLQSITLPTTPIKLDVRSCRDLHRIAVVGDATKLTWLSIGQCPALEELPSLARMSCLEVIEIDSCDKLQSITLPTTPIKLYVGSCRDLHRIALVGDLTKLKSLTIKQCPALEELPSLARMSCLEDIVIDSCQKLHNVAGIEESYELEWMILNNCGNAVIRNCIHGLKSLPIAFLKMIGKAVDGAEASLNKNLFCDANIGVHAVIENDSENTVSEWPIWNSGIGCYLVVIDNEDEDEDEDDSFNAREGEWIITMVGPDYLIYDACKNLLRRNGIVKKGVLIEVTDGEQWTNVEVLRRIVDRLYHL